MTDGALLSPLAALCYVAVLRRWTATTAEVAEELGIEKIVAAMWLCDLGTVGLIFPIGTKSWRAWRAPGDPPRGGPGAVRGTSSKEEVSRTQISSEEDLKRSVNNADVARVQERVRARASELPRKPSAPSRKMLLDLEAVCKPCDLWTPYGLTGRYIRRWEDAFGIEYKPPVSYVRDVWCAEQLLAAEGDLAVWCVEALFDKQLAWLNGKTLEFVSNQAHRNRHVRTVAVALRRSFGTAPVSGMAAGTVTVNIPGR